MAAIDPVGPYENWMFGPGRYYDLPGLQLDQQPSLSALVEFSNPVGASALAAVTNLLTADAITWQPRLPVLYRPGVFHPHFLPVLLTPSGPPVFDPATIATLLTQLAAGSTQNQIRLNFPVRSETVGPATPTTTLATPDPSVDPGKPLVILAVIDHGIPFAHRSFRTATSTRVDYCWSQSAETDGSGAVIFGREFRRDTIEALMTAHNGDEDALYRASGLLGRANLPPMPLARLNAHGAHILGTAAGQWATDPEQIRIIAVDLPATSVWDTSGFGTDMFLLAAFHYIFDRAEKIAAAYGRPDMPLVINLSYGQSGGPHDGSTLLSAALDEMIAYRRALAPTALILPSGNMFQDQLHARIDDSHFTLDPSGTTRSTKLTWLSPPADRTSSFIELWYPPGTSASDVRVNLKPPRGIPDDPSLAIQGAGRQDMVVAGRTVGQLEVDKYRGTRWRVTIILAPSEARDLPPAPHGPLPAGEWTITLRRPNTLMTGSIDARIQRDTNFGQGNTGAQQSYFIDPAYDRFDGKGALSQHDTADPSVKIRRFGGLNGIADGATGLIAAGYRASTGEAASYSSVGPSPGASPARSVSLSALTDRAAFTTGLTSTGTRTGVTVAQNGTSVAAPQAARFLAERFYAVATPGPTADNYLSLFNLPPDSAPITPMGPGPLAQDRLGLYRLAPPPPWPLP